MEILAWGLALYARYVATVLILGASVALAAWLFFAIESRSKRHTRSARRPSD